MVADGLVRPRELRLLDGVRRQLGISEREHEQILARLSEEERQLFEEHGGLETHAQLEGYQVALAEALQRNATEEEIDELRQRFGVDTGSHQMVLARIRGESGELLSRARSQLERAKRLHGDLAAIGASEPTPARVFLCFLLRRAVDERLSRLIELLEIAGDGPVIQSLRRRLFVPDPALRAQVLKVLALACPGAEELVHDLEPLLAGQPRSGVTGADAELQVLARLLADLSPNLRAGAVWAASALADPSLEAALARARDDEHPLVRETAERFVGRSAGEQPDILSSIETMYFLHVAPFFADLDPSDLYDFSQFAMEQTVHPPAAICEAGDIDSDALFVVVSGKAVVLGRPSGDLAGAVRPIATLGRGDLVGELSVLDGSPRSATVRPEGGPLRLLRIPGPSLRGALLHSPRVAESLLGLLAGRIRRLV
jgi:hypothetical protein